MLNSMSRIPLSTLPAFATVARLGNLRAAAEALHLTHSAVSQQIRLLEEQTGLQLFDRPGRRIVLNAAGRALLAGVQPALAQLDAALAEARAASSRAEATLLRLTVLPSFAQRWLLPRMGRWREAAPDIVIDLHSSQHIEDLQRQGFDAALRQGRGPWRGLHCEPLLVSPRIAVGAPAAAQRLAGRGPAALADEALLGSPRQWQAWFKAQGLSPRIAPVAAFNDAGLMLQAAEQGLGLALARELLAADALASGSLVRLSPHALPDDEPDQLWLVCPPERADWPPLLRLRDWLRAELARSAAGLGDARPAAG
ncbi:MAG: LysR family transcriptional regulator [Burkholderiaceae bacterium]|nr:LysR family transcriptional regulator [Burkholderiaceae bacterium]